ncbi:hypothetical protein F511_01911 [Dorcoceras hygrometricum]|uniref:Uncharacterized protein n=1 Tax=Dorcoceras hygrometricum TaxID=472368 RepID=A0A2Z7D2L8_9LAMI|nr:hypothetical protein F511_01911 [Dorcoceras hygrometricum]
MENNSWEQKMIALTHILTTPTTSPHLHYQLFIATQLPCYLHCHPSSAPAFTPPLLKWAISRSIERISRSGLHQASWRSICPPGVEEPRWSDEEKRRYVWKRFTRKRLGCDVNPWIPIVIPNMLLLSLLLWDPIPLDDT